MVLGTDNGFSHLEWSGLIFCAISVSEYGADYANLEFIVILTDGTAVRVGMKGGVEMNYFENHLKFDVLMW